MVGQLFGISPKEAAEKIANDFGISYENQSKNNVDGKRGIVNRIKKEHEKEKKNHIFRVLCSYFKLLQDWKRELAPSSTDDEVNPLFVEALMNYEYVDNIIEQLISGNQDEKDKIICDVETDVEKFEEILKQYIVSNTDVEIFI